MTVRPMQASRARKALVIYDGDCPFCRRSVRLLRGLDWLGLLDYGDARHPERLPGGLPPLDPARLLEEMHVVTPDRRSVRHGFRALRWLAWRLPLAAPLAVLLYLPGVPALGQRLYLWVARNRMGLVPCSHGACQVPRKRPG